MSDGIVIPAGGIVLQGPVLSSPTGSIDDNVISAYKTWSSYKINEELVKQSAEIANISDTVDAISETTRNLWSEGDQSFENKKVITLTEPIPAGSYVMSASIDSKASSATSRVALYKGSESGANQLAVFSLHNNATRDGAVFTIGEDADVVVLYSGSNADASVGHSVAWMNIQIESGSQATEYIPHRIAVDFVARTKNEKQDAEIATVSGEIDANAKRIKYLYELSKGQVYDTETDTTEAYSKTVVEGAVACAIKKVGGKSIIQSGEIVNAAVTGVKSMYQGTVVDEILIPEEIRALPGYGWSAGEISNHIDFDRKVYVQCVNRFDATVKTYNISSTYGTLYTTISDTKMASRNAIAENYEIRTTAVNLPVGCFAIPSVGAHRVHFNAGDTSIMPTGWVYYEMNTYIETDVSQWLPDPMLDVVDGGSIVFEQSGTQTPVPNEVTYFSKLNKIDEISDTVERNKAEHDKQIDALWKIMRGQVYDIAEQVETGANVPPIGAMFGTVEDVRGKSEQATVNGWNLCDLSIIPEQHTSTGITSTSLGDGKFVLTGTPSIETGILITIGTGSYDTVKLEDLIEGHTYKNVMFHTGSGGSIQYTENSVVKYSGLFVYNSDITKVNPYIQIMTEDYEDGMIVGCMLYDATEHTGSVAWEPYTGGVPAPNPDYPQEIHSVEELNVKVTGKNLLDFSHRLNGYIDGNGNFQIANANWATDYFAVKAGKSYILSSSQTLSGGGIAFYSVDKTLILRNTNIYRTGENTIEAPDGARYARVWININGSAISYDEFTLVNNQLERGSIATAYEQYTEQTRTITPPMPLNKIGDVFDFADIEAGVWKYRLTDVVPNSYTASYDSSNMRFKVQPSGFEEIMQGEVRRIAILCDRYINMHSGGGISSDLDGVFYNDRNSTQIYIHDHRFTDATAFIADLAGTHFVYTNAETAREQIASDDLEFLRSLELIPADHTITITDQDGINVSYMVEYLIRLSEVMGND